MGERISRFSVVSVVVVLALLCALAAQGRAGQVDDRVNQLIQDKIDNPWPDPLSTDPETRKWGYPTYALAALYMGQDLTTANDYINDWYVEFPVKHEATIEANADFKLNMFWRMYLHPTTSTNLTQASKDIIEDMMWRWIDKRSKVSDAMGSTWNYHGSENHDAMQKVGFLMCAQALKDAGAPYGPDRPLTDGYTIAQHAEAWSGYFERYFRDRAKEGINAEIACPGYAKYTMGVYYNIRDFAETADLREMAEKFINLYWADTACDWVSSGVRGGAETRAYKDSYMRKGGSYSFRDVTWAYGWKSDHGTLHPVGLHLATSTYRVPDIITAIAADTNRPNYLYTSRRWGRTDLGMVDDVNYITFDGGDSSMLRETWVTPDYAMGSLTLDMNKDYIQIIDQNRAAGVMFSSGIDDRVMIFGKGHSSDNKSYADLSGVTREDCMVVQRDKNANSSGDGMLIFVPTALWTNRVETNGWIFLEAGNAYCAVKPAGGGYVASNAAYGVDLELGDMWAPVIMQTGQASNYAGYGSFQASVQSNTLTYSSGTMNYTSEAGDTFTFYANSRTTPRVNGSTVELNPTKTYDSPYLSMVHGEDVATVSYGSYSNLVLDFWLPLPSGTVTVLTSDSLTVQDVGSPGPVNLEANPSILSFDAGNDATKLVVTLSSECGGGGPAVITYNGQALTQAQAGSGKTLGIWYLDNPYTGGVANLQVDMTSYGTVNGLGVGVLSLAGTAPGCASSAVNATNSVTVSTAVSNSLVMVGYGKNGSTGVSPDAPLTELYSGDIGSAMGCAGYHLALAPATNTYSVTSADHAVAGTVAAVFSPDIGLRVDVSAGAQIVTQGVARLNGYVTEDADVSIYWDVVDRGTNATAWSQSATLGATPAGTFYQDASNLLYGLTYNYRCYASNTVDAATAWSGASSFSLPLPGSTLAVINSGSLVVPDTGTPGPANLEANPTNLSFNAGAQATKLVVTLSSECGGGGTPIITYNGQALTRAAPASGKALGVWYLDNPHTGGVANLTIDMTSFSPVNGIGVAAVSLSGTASGYMTNSVTTTNSLTIPTALGNSFVMVGYGNNGSAIASADWPLTELYGAEIGSAVGAAGYDVVDDAGTNVFMFSSSDVSQASTVAAAFAPDVVTDVSQLDANNDGVADVWTVHHFAADPFVAGQDDGDPDGDSLSNQDEYVAGSDPTNGLDVFEIDLIYSNDALVVSIPSRLTTSELYGSLSRKYCLESNTNMLGTNWTLVTGAEDVPATGFDLTHINASGAETLYYRAKTWLEP